MIGKTLRPILFFFCLLGAQALLADGLDTSLEGLDGKHHRLGEYIGKGKWVIVNVWGPACPPCIDEMPELEEFHQAHKDVDAIVLGVALDYPSFGYAKADVVKKFIDENFITFPILLADAEIVSAFSGAPLEGTPTTYVYTGSGELVAMQLGAVSRKIIEDFISGYKPD
ncbi:TlpA family protein disulfide reductase [Thiogranum longum]|jgi:thiol-disulfide isomerase/thioredoxin